MTRVATHDDLKALATLHQAAFPAFYLTSLGGGFLRLYYRAVLECDGGVLLVSQHDSGLTGFVAGYLDPEGFHAHLRRYRLRALITILPKFVINPGLLPRTIRRFRQPRPPELEKAGPAVCELSSIAVAPSAQGTGTGRDLLVAFFEAARKLGANEVRLTTDALENDAVNRFYSRAGFQLHCQFSSYEGRQMNEYRLILSEVQPQ